MGWGNQHGDLGNFREDSILPYPRATAWSTPFPVAQTSHGCYGHPNPWYRVLWEEVLVAAFEDIHLRIVEAGVVVGGSGGEYQADERVFSQGCVQWCHLSGWELTMVGKFAP